MEYCEGEYDIVRIKIVNRKLLRQVHRVEAVRKYHCSAQAANSQWGETFVVVVDVDDDFVQVIQYLRGSVCGFSGRLPDVCCPKDKPVGDENFGSFWIEAKSRCLELLPCPLFSLLQESSRRSKAQLRHQVKTTLNLEPIMDIGQWQWWQHCTSQLVKCCEMFPHANRRMTKLMQWSTEAGLPGPLSVAAASHVETGLSSGPGESTWIPTTSTYNGDHLRSCTKPAPGPGGNACQGEEREEVPCAAATQCGQSNFWFGF